MFANKLGHLFLFVLFHCAVQSSADTVSWDKLIEKTRVWSADLSINLRAKYLSNSNVQKLSIACNHSLWHTLDAIDRSEDWAIQMYNSWGSFPPSGIRVGTNTDFGSYDQCLDIDANDVIGKPQYCLIDVIPPIPQPMPVHHNLHHRIHVLSDDLDKSIALFDRHSEFASFYYWVSLRTGICVPSQCTPHDIQLMAKGFAEDFGLQLKRSRCETRDTTRLTSIQIAAISFIILVLCVTITVSTYETFLLKTKDNILLDAFSLKRNIRCLFASRSTEVFPCIHGLRVLTLFWVIFSHSTEWTNFQLFSRTFRIKELFARFESQLVLNGEYAVENFFFIGGMLTSFITFQYTRGQLSRFSIIGFLLARFLRLTPQLFIFILLTFLLPLIGSGPIWTETIGPIVETCATNWWYNFFYIQNLFRAPQICALHSWFLACDMQYHWMSLVLMVALLYKYHLGLVLSGLSVLAFYVLSVVIAYTYDLPPGLINTGRDQYFLEYYIDLFYIKPWSHSTVFFIGLLFGIIAYKKKFIALTKLQRLIIILLVITGYVLCLMDTFLWTGGQSHDPLISALIFSTCRILWSLSTAALVWLCISGNGGPINRFLSANVFTPLSRVTYSVYLTHVWVIWMFVGTRRERIDTNWTEFVFIFGHNLVIAYAIGFLFAILFEMPVIKLQKRLVNRFVVKDDHDQNEQVELKVHLNGANNKNHHV